MNPPHHQFLEPQNQRKPRGLRHLALVRKPQNSWSRATTRLAVRGRLGAADAQELHQDLWEMNGGLNLKCRSLVEKMAGNTVNLTGVWFLCKKMVLSCFILRIPGLSTSKRMMGRIVAPMFDTNSYSFQRPKSVKHMPTKIRQKQKMRAKSEAQHTYVKPANMSCIQNIHSVKTGSLDFRSINLRELFHRSYLGKW